MQAISNSNNNQPSTSQEGYVDENPINVMVMLQSLLANKRWLLVIFGIGTLIAVIFALLQPKYFSAQIRIMPPINNSSGGQAALLNALGSGSGGAASMLGLKTPGELYVGLLKSRSVTDHIINKFSLKDVYEIKTFQKTRLQLFNFTKVTAGKDGIISIDVEDKDPKRAADIANEYFYALQNMMQRMAVTEAGQRRLFFETQLKQAKNQLTDAEEAFKTMQQTTGVLQLDAQGKVEIEAVAKMRAAISAKEVELASLRQYATPENPEYQRKASEMAALRNEFNKLERSQTGDNTETTAHSNGRNRKLTDSGLDYARRLRDLKYAETVFELLAKQFEFARLDESRETASLQLIDEAVIPELPSRPNRLLLVIAGSFFSLLLAIVTVLLKTRKEWLNS